jgi:SAM-dependent methyltransferase
MRIVNTGLQAYLQRYPFGKGSDPAMDIAGREAVRNALQPREAGTPIHVVQLTAQQTILPSEEMQRLLDFLVALQFNRAKQLALIDDFAWEVNLVPRTIKNILCVGCGDGMELVFLRAILPNAKITAIDYHDSLSPEVKRIVDLTFLEGDMNRHLGALAGGYDLIFSNHTLEHLYTPDEMIRTLHRLLAPGGSLISTLPMDANEGSPFLGRVARAVDIEGLHPLDAVFLDPGHPWKTNPADLNRTFAAAGFSEVSIFQRARQLSRSIAGGRLRFELGKNTGLVLNALFFGTTRAFIKLAVPRSALIQTNRILLAIERRVWFGTNNLKNRYTEEVLVRADKSS